MNQLQLYINDQLVDLNDDSPIALTFQINNLAEVQNQQGNTSNQFKLPLTQRNRQILGFPDDIAFTTNAPYQQYPARLIQDGLEIIPYGIAELNNIEQDNANVTVLSGNVDFFDAIDGKLYDMGDSTSQWTNYGQNLVWKQYDHTWNLQNAATSQTKTDGWIYPVIDYGFINGQDFTPPIDVHYLRPGFFIKSAIDLLLQSAGYKGKGSLLDDPLYPLLICQFSNSSWEHGADYQNRPDNRSCAVATGINKLLDHPSDANPNGTLTWDLINSDPSHQFSGGTTFVSSQTNNILVTVTFPHVRMTGKITGNHPTHFKVVLITHTSAGDAESASIDFTWDMGSWQRTSGDGGNIKGYVDIYNTVVSFQTTLNDGESVEVRYTWLGDNPSSFVIYQGATFTVQSQNQNVQFGQTVQCERIFPDISQKDLLKDTLQRFGIICQTDNATRTVSFNSLRDIVNNIPIASDWTGKCIDQGKQVSFQLGSYAQVNYMKYKEDDNVLPKDFANAQININDTTLPATADLLESQFAPTLNRPYLIGQIAQIKMIDNTSDSMDFSVGVSPRILIDQKTRLPSGKTITFTDGTTNITVNDTISTPYFYKPEGDYNLCFCDMPGTANTTLPGLKTKYYPELQKVLTQTKKVIRYFLLTPRDILELDLLIPVYLQQDNAYYYINKIDSWRKGQPCKVELVKLG
ncbi:MAG: hypothetical protein JST50_01005 [Bacteroidetes bacterium]|jgi:hypothetical protein|nr:hypothetical protein [Bacteroidota bacterium]